MGYDPRPMLIRVGQNPSALSVAKYAKHFDLLEVKLDTGVPRKRTLESMKSEAPPALVFAVVVPKLVSALAAEPTEAEVTATIDVARGWRPSGWLCERRPRRDPAAARGSDSHASSSC
jgi:hypothetical protein